MTFEYPEKEYLSSVQPTSLHNVKKVLAALSVAQALYCIFDGHPKSPGRYLVV